MTACAILLRYLCDTAAAPLQRCLVEREDAYAGDVRFCLSNTVKLKGSFLVKLAKICNCESDLGRKSLLYLIGQFTARLEVIIQHAAALMSVVTIMAVILFLLVPLS